MTFFKKKTTAVTCMVLLILFSVVFGSYRSLNAQRSKAIKAYSAGDETGLSILANLNSITEQTASLLKTAADCGLTDSTEYIEVDKAYQALATGKDIDAERLALSSLLTALTSFQTMYKAQASIPADSAKAMTRYINDIISFKDQIRHSGYVSLAAAFNAELEGFPAGFLADLTGVKALPLF